MKLRKKNNWRPRLETLEARRLLTAYADFNGDGLSDLAVGVPEEDLGAITAAGAVHILYGTSAGGVTSVDTQIWTQDTPGILEVAEANDRFGLRMATGDFNGDGFADLAISASGESIGAVNGAGLVHVIYGSEGGLRSNGNQVFHQDTPGMLDVNEPSDRFGAPLAAGDFNGDGVDDLAIGMGSEDFGSLSNAGAVSVLYGRAGAGLVAIGARDIGEETYQRPNQVWSLNSPGVPGDPAEGDLFGAALSAADFNGDGYADLAIGVPRKTANDANYAGKICILFGTKLGLTSTDSQLLDQRSVDADNSEAGDEFGKSLAAGDFNGDGLVDLAVGAGFEDINGQNAAGAVTILYSSADDGVAGKGSQFITQDDLDTDTPSEADDSWGYALAAGDFDDDGFADLASGAFKDIGSALNAGAVSLMYGAAAGLAVDGARFVIQESMPTGAVSATSDLFGLNLGVADFENDGRDDLIIGAEGKDVGAVDGAGEVFVMSAVVNQRWNQDSPGIPDDAEAGDDFGAGIPAGDGKSAPGGGSSRQDLAHFITADVDLNSLTTKLNKRRFLSSRR